MDERIKKILGKMSIEEKVAQLTCIERNELLEKEHFSKEKAIARLKNGAGQVSPILRPFGPEEGTRISNEIQKIALEESSSKISVIIHDECIHGCMAKKSTSFPQSIALASSWDPDMMYQVAKIIGKETRSRGIHQALSPTINIARDARHGRVEETYGEDPYLTSKMAVAFIKGLQSEKVIATPKHFAADFAGDGGRDSSAVFFSERILREVFFPAFKASIMEAKAWSLMAAYNSINGIPSSSNRWLLTDVLRNQWGFEGFVVSDYGSVWGLYGSHRVASTVAEAGKLALEAGLDIEIPASSCFSHLARLVKEGRVSEATVDRVVERVLKGKIWLGLFENPYADPAQASLICDCDQHRQFALKVAEQCMVLLENNGILPLSKDIGSIAVIGPNADAIRLGGYSGSGIKVVSVFEGIKNSVSKRTRVYFAEGCRVNDKDKSGFSKAVNAAAKADVAILVMGNSAETEGENRDRCNLNLPGVQEDLIRAIADTGTPVIVVLINGSAVTMVNWFDSVDAVLEAWYPGEEGGNAVANIIFGNSNPAGKLPITFPRFTGQLPLYYNHLPCLRKYDYVEVRGFQPMFPFGYGLSYTQFEYRNLKVSPEKFSGKGNVNVSVEVENTGNYEGDEIVQLYLRDVVSSIIRPVKELKRFSKVHLKPGEKTKVEFALEESDLSFLDENFKSVLEPGVFEVMVGKNSTDLLITKFELK
ncbi:MAG TPA: glycoside hydrolase family 3 N-terminal domain-containing protein [bacterium]|nr:glycoside hydrolase family 3 N-terminal domain-containing protein [bacterium]HPO51859.1 glycoside hydrolase family 3 N-terminal domain-containing protein [bacterium]